MTMLMALALCAAPVAVDGDTVRCGPHLLRLLGIDAPELPGHCRKGRICVPGDPYRSQHSLARAMQGKRVTWQKFGTDRYGRPLVMIWAGPRNLACHQLATGNARYKIQWDDGLRIKRACQP